MSRCHYWLAIGTLDTRSPLPWFTFKSAHDELSVLHGRRFPITDDNQNQRPRPCNATPVTITVVTSIMVTVIITMPRYATRHMLGMQKCTGRAIRRIASFCGQVSWAERSLGNAAPWARNC
jgi:hypothetical protein